MSSSVMTFGFGRKFLNIDFISGTVFQPGTTCAQESCVPVNREPLQVHPLVPAGPRDSVPYILHPGNDTLQTPRDALSFKAMLSCAFLLWLSLIPKILVEMGVVATNSAATLGSPHYS